MLSVSRTAVQIISFSTNLISTCSLNKGTFQCIHTLRFMTSVMTSVRTSYAVLGVFSFSISIPTSSSSGQTEKSILTVYLISDHSIGYKTSDFEIKYAATGFEPVMMCHLYHFLGSCIYFLPLSSP